MPRSNTNIPVRDDGLQINDDRRFQNRFWIAERVAWITFGLIILAALAGLTGNGGPLAQGHRAADGVSVSYPAIARWRAEDELVIRLPQGGEERVLQFDARFRHAFDVVAVSPAPVAGEALPDGLRWRFPAGAGGPTEIRMAIEPRRPGRVAYTLRVPPGDGIELWTLVLP